MALCFPTCDRPQLTLLSEAGVWLLVSGIRNTERNPADLWSGLPHEENREQLEPLEILKKHELLRQLRMFLLHFFIYRCLMFQCFSSLLHDSRISRLTSLGRGSWKDRFKHTLLLYYNSQRMSALCTHESRIPTLDAYLSVRRDMLGISIMFDLAELLEVFPFPEVLHGTQREILEKIRQCAFNIMAWSFVSCPFHRTLLCSLLFSGRCVLPYHSRSSSFQSVNSSYGTKSYFDSGSDESCR